jgi:hypothetical protein
MNNDYSRKLKGGSSSKGNSGSYDTAIQQNPTSKKIEKLLNKHAEHGWHLREIVPIQIGNFSYNDQYKYSSAFGFSNTKYLQIILEKYEK